jgi:glycosyltransferase involved in cell wall biosynthesis
MAPFFSIVIPTFNRADMLSKAIDSVVAQSYSDWELIIVDDGSTDNTKALVDNYCSIDKRIRYIYQENAERSAARNNGIVNAKGEFICFLDSDDYYLPQRIEFLAQNIIDSGFIFYTGLVLETKKGKEHRNEKPVNGLKKFNELCSATIHSQQVCIPNSIAKKFKFDIQFRIGEDLELWLRINNEFPFHYFDNAFHVVLVDHVDRTISQKNNSGIEQLKLFNRIFNVDHPGKNISNSVKRTLISNSYYTIFKYWFYNNNRLKSLKFLIKCIFANLQSNQLKFRINILIQIMLFKSFEKINRILN